MRRKTDAVKIGNVTLSSTEPVMVQSMLNTSTMDTEACVEQAIRIIQAGGELVRITAPGIREGKNLKQIHQMLRERGYDVPLSADIHFTPEVALIAAQYVEKVRINPGNFVDKRAIFKQLNYTDEEYQLELELLRKKFIEFLEICREYGTAVRIGTNHGSLSDRIMSRYGDTPQGMVEATMEYLRVCQDVHFSDIVISLKSSDCRIMVDAVRLLVREMEREEMHYPLHLGVTEAGEGEDGRIRSAIGIGTLLNEGIGDTIRVSLTEAPEAEIPVANLLVEVCDSPNYEAGKKEIKGTMIRPNLVADLSTVKKIGIKEWKELELGGIKSPEMIYVEQLDPILGNLPEQMILLTPLELWQEAHKIHARTYPFCSKDDYLDGIDLPSDLCLLVRLTGYEELTADFALRLQQDPRVILVFSFGVNYHAYREAFLRMHNLGLSHQTLLQVCFEQEEQEKWSLKIAAQIGGLFLDRLPGGLWIIPPRVLNSGVAIELSRNILQSAGVRRYKAEFISCPGCGRTLFDLQSAVSKVKKAFGHLNSLKIAVMGCVVNGPGEMGDADFGYVGAGNGKVNLYQGRKMVRVAIPEKDAIEALRQLIESTLESSK